MNSTHRAEITRSNEYDGLSSFDTITVTCAATGEELMALTVPGTESTEPYDAAILAAGFVITGTEGAGTDVVWHLDRPDLPQGVQTWKGEEFLERGALTRHQGRALDAAVYQYVESVCWSAFLTDAGDHYLDPEDVLFAMWGEPRNQLELWMWRQIWESTTVGYSDLGEFRAVAHRLAVDEEHGMADAVRTAAESLPGTQHND
jgi:hypothetical protein